MSTIRTLVVLLAVVAASCSASSDPTTTTTTTTTVPSIYASVRWSEAEDWAESAMTLDRTEDWDWTSRTGAEEFARKWAHSTCMALSKGENPIVVKADFRAEMTVSAWVSYGEVWWDSLVNGLCIRR